MLKFGKLTSNGNYKYCGFLLIQEPLKITDETSGKEVKDIKGKSIVFMKDEETEDIFYILNTSIKGYDAEKTPYGVFQKFIGLVGNPFVIEIDSKSGIVSIDMKL